MSGSTLRSKLPVVYGPLLSELFDEPEVRESRATCDSCQMCDRGGGPPELAASYFRPDTKCCTFHPTLPNYLVGAILADERPEAEEGKRRIREQIRKRVNVAPQRLAPSKKWSLLYKAASTSSFGRSALLRCPYLDGERCSIWHHRESVCFTFFCKHDDGVAGASFWTAMRSYLVLVESYVSSWAARQVAPEVKEPLSSGPEQLTLAELEEGPPEPAVYERAWGSWVGREEEFYLACHERVRSLTREQFAKFVDQSTNGRQRLEKLKEALVRLRAARQIPDRLAMHRQLRVLPVEGGVVITTPYNPYDSMRLDTDLYDVLRTFTYDQTVADTRASLERDQGIELEDALLSMFTMHEILVPPPKAGQCDADATPKLRSARGYGASVASKVASLGSTTTSKPNDE